MDFHLHEGSVQKSRWSLTRKSTIVSAVTAMRWGGFNQTRDRVSRLSPTSIKSGHRNEVSATCALRRAFPEDLEAEFCKVLTYVPSVNRCGVFMRPGLL